MDLVILECGQEHLKLYALKGLLGKKPQASMAHDWLVGYFICSMGN